MPLSVMLGIALHAIAAIVAGRGLVWLDVCGRWLWVWLLGSITSVTPVLPLCYLDGYGSPQEALDLDAA